MVYLKHKTRKRYQDKWQVKCRRNRAGDKSKSAEEDAFSYRKVSIFKNNGNILKLVKSVDKIW